MQGYLIFFVVIYLAKEKIPEVLTPQWVAVELLKSKIKDQATHTIKPKSGSITVRIVTVLNRIRPPTFAMVSWNITKRLIQQKINVEYLFELMSQVILTHWFIHLVQDHATFFETCNMFYFAVGKSLSQS